MVTLRAPPPEARDACSLAPLPALALLLACAHAAPAPAAPATRGYDAELTNFVYPFAVRFFSFESQGQPLRMAYMDVPPETAPVGTVLLLHGKNFSGAYWEPTARALADEGFRVIIPDQVGFGKSSKQQNYQFTFQQLATNTEALLRSLGVERVAVVGHSMGGMLATRFSLMFPGRVERLVLVNPIGLEDWKTQVPYRTIDENERQELKATRDGIREYMRDAYFAGRWLPEYEPLVEMLAGWAEGPDLPKIAHDAALTTDMIFTQPVVYEFPLVKAPTLLIIGQRDRTAIGKAWASPEVAAKLGDYPRLGREAAKAIPGAKLVEIENAGHLPQVEAFDAYRAALVGFLAHR